MLVNHLHAPTAVHWQGIEVQNSYIDGVPAGAGRRGISPALSHLAIRRRRVHAAARGHVHVPLALNEGYQISSGLYGAIVVTEAGSTYDPATNRIFVLGGNGPDHNRARVNGVLDPAPETLTVGVTYRFRIADINPDWRVFASLVSDTTTLRWRAVAKDGADLPVHQATMRAARVLMGPGETADFEYTPVAPGMLRLEFATMLAGWKLSVPSRVEAAKH